MGTQVSKSNEEPNWEALKPVILNALKKKRKIGAGTFANVFEISIQSQPWAIKESKDYIEDVAMEQEVLKEVHFMTNPKYKHENLMSAEYYFFHEN